jgi:hypothetical protein
MSAEKTVADIANVKYVESQFSRFIRIAMSLGGWNETRFLDERKFPGLILL